MEKMFAERSKFASSGIIFQASASWTRTRKKADVQRSPRRNNSSRKIFPSLGKPRGKVEYLVGEIEKITNDTHSKRMFEIIADALPDVAVFQILSGIKQGEGIRNRGAVFVAAAKKWIGKRGISRRQKGG